MTRHQWLLIVVIAVGLIGMHHLLVHTAHAMPMPMMSVTHTGHAGPDPAGVNSVEARSTSTTVASQPDCCDPMDMVGHCCLAVLTAIAALAAALIVAVARRRPLEPEHLLAAVSAVAARAPPIGCVRLTQLCVLRR